MNVTEAIQALKSDNSSKKKEGMISTFLSVPIRDMKDYERFASDLSVLLPVLWEEAKIGKKYSWKLLKSAHEKLFSAAGGASGFRTTGFFCVVFDNFQQNYPTLENKIANPEVLGINKSDILRVAYPQKYQDILKLFESNGRKQDLSPVQEVVHAPA